MRNTHTHNMPFFGLATTGDLENLATKGDLENLATKGDLENLATKGDLENLATKGDLEKTASCTQIINGVHICSIPKYDKIVEPNDFRIGSVIDSSEKVCLHFDHIPDVVGTATAAAMSKNIGHGDIPDNYVCVDAAKTTQYFKAIVPEAMQPMAKGFLDMVSMDDLRARDMVSMDDLRARDGP